MVSHDTLLTILALGAATLFTLGMIVALFGR